MATLLIVEDDHKTNDAIEAVNFSVSMEEKSFR